MRNDFTRLFGTKTKIVLRRFFCSGLMFTMLIGTHAVAQDAVDIYDNRGSMASVYDVKIDINFRDASLEEVLDYIESKTPFSFSYDKSDIHKENFKFNFAGWHISLAKVLEKLSIEAGLGFMDINHNIYLKNISGQPSFAIGVIQPIQVTGRVTSAESKYGLPGVSVLVKGTGSGTVTDADGNFSINTPTEDDILVFSSIGYITQEVAVNGRAVIDVILVEDILSLKEIVVVGYGEVEKRDFTGSLNSLGADEFNSGVQVSVDQMIQGRAPGVQVTQTSAEPGGGSSIRIRGSNSITAGNEPLYVIDGLPINNTPGPGSGMMDERTPRNPLNAINPGDIESIEILKDASATAIYGSRGANGVILITTKNGKPGKMKINYNGYAGLQSVAKKLDLLNATEYALLLNGIREDEGASPVFTQEQINSAGKGTDWQEEIFQVAPVQNHELSFSGGSDNTAYYLSLNYLDQKGVVISSGTKRYAARLNLNHSANKFNFGINLNTSLLLDDYVPNGVGINVGAGVIATALQMDPTLPVRNASGGYAESADVDLDNPVALANTIFDDAETNRTFGNIFAEYTVINDLKAKINFGSDRHTVRRDGYISKITKRGQQANGFASISEQERANYLVELTLNYDKEFNETHKVNAVAGYTYQEFSGRGFSASARNFPTDAYLTNDLSAGEQAQYSIGSGRFKNQLLSYLGRVNYTLLDKYLITASFRADGSSRFGEDNKFGYFPSLAMAWRLSDESFVSNLNLFSDLKLRTSYGVTGNQEIGNYQSQVLLDVTGEAIYNESRYVGIAPVQIGNPQLKWETTKQFNVGLDFGTLKGRISGSLDYFTKRTSDLLLFLPIPLTSGFSTFLQNVGDTQNSGFELLINSENLLGNFEWSTTFNLATIKNKVTDLGPLDNILQGGLRFINQFSILKEGEPINAYFGYQVEGIFQSQDEISGSAQPAARLGELRFKDVNNDNQINADDRTILGDPYPDFSFGVSNYFSYKGFDLSIFFDGSYGNEMLNFTRIDSEGPIEFRRNRMDFVLNRWTLENTTNENPSFISNARPLNSRVVEDASYLRLRNVRIGYTFPDIKRIASLSLFVTAQNLFTITDYSGFNPDVSVLGNSNLRLDYNAYPLSKIYTMGVNIGL